MTDQTGDSSSRSDSVVESNNQPDYESVQIPAKPPSEYSYVQRRADLLSQIYDLGHPSMIHQGEAADRYDVSQSQISKDIKRLGEHVDQELGARRAIATDAVFQRAIQGLLEEGEYRDAARTVKDWNEWVDEYKELSELQERLAALEENQNRSDYQLK